MSARPPKKILVVDDEPSVTGSLELILTENGFEVLTANSFADSTAILNQTSVDLVITDLRLADASGIDLIKHIKKSTPEIEVILMTGPMRILITNVYLISRTGTELLSRDIALALQEQVLDVLPQARREKFLDELEAIATSCAAVLEKPPGKAARN